jgi:spore coat protein U-like protein
MKRTVLFTIITLATLVLTTSAFAASPVSTANTNNITASVAGNCTVSAFSITFGAYDPLVTNASTPLDNVTNKVNVFCTKGTAVTSVSLSAGADFGLGPIGAGMRSMKSTVGANYLSFEIYNDSLGGTVWNTTNTVSGTSTSKGSAINGGFTLYGRVPAGQDVAVASYQETIDATVNF